MTPMEKRIAALETVLWDMLLGNAETDIDRFALMERLEEAGKEYRNETEGETQAP